MRRKRPIAMLTAAVLLAAHGVAVANIAMPRGKWTELRMVREHVRIVMAPTRVAVEGTYILRNTGKAVEAVVGYPQGMLEESLDDFRVTVDGKPVEKINTEEGWGRSAYRNADKKPGKPVKLPYQFTGPYPAWKTWTMKFDEKQTRTVVVRYHVAPTEIKTVDRGKLLAFIYILKTGATWKGNIEKAVVEVHLTGLSRDRLVTVSPPADTRTGGVLVWVFKNFKPTRDLEITFRPKK